MKVGLDATPLIGPRTGIGRYVEGLVDGLSLLAEPPQLVLVPFTWRGFGDLPVVPRAATLTDTPQPLRRGRRFPARALHALWSRVDWPPVEVLSGSLDVFHATNFVLPPTRRAAGVVTIHDLSYLRHADTVSAATLRYRELVPRGLARARAVVADTQTVGDEIAAEYGVGADRLVVAPLGLSATWLSPPRPYDARELHDRGWPERFVLFVG
ncbi:MAG: glycosyltransferase, partial [Mycobacteriales bacterium]